MLAMKVSARGVIFCVALLGVFALQMTIGWLLMPSICRLTRRARALSWRPCRGRTVSLPPPFTTVRSGVCSGIVEGNDRLRQFLPPVWLAVVPFVALFPARPHRHVFPVGATFDNPLPDITPVCITSGFVVG